MIGKETVEAIIEAARIEEVVGDFVDLKRRGANLLGLCPFHNEKSPSFTVSPAKGIFKCFGCGKAGNSVNFIMEHEHFTYPEALKFLAKRYNIEVEEEKKEYSPEEIQEQNEKESLFVISSHAQKYFTDTLWETEEGRNIGLSYFRERGFSDEIIKKFQLGYSPEKWTAYSDQALKERYKKEHLTGTGLGIESDGRMLDRFRGRVMFPIHSLAGRVLAFGGRTLLSDKKAAKYLNSPESLIYSKSKVLYGIFYSRKAISNLDTCYLVEGYTDVISLFQAGIENVVASSGTSLTTDQIRLIKRYTSNVTILYDGDPAGIKASMRGINMILEQGMNVKIVLFPEGEDPDSFARKNGGAETTEYLKEHAKDFIVFKASLLLKEAGNDPLKKAALVHDVVESIALVSDNIMRSYYEKECAELFEMEQTVIIQEVNKFRSNYLHKKAAGESRNQQRAITPSVEFDPAESTDAPPTAESITDHHKGIYHQELDLIRLLLSYGEKVISDPFEVEGEEPTEVAVAYLIVGELSNDHLEMTWPAFRKIYNIYLDRCSKNDIPTLAEFMHHEDPEVRKTAIDVSTSQYQLSEGWEKHNITVNLEESGLTRAVLGAIYSYKIRHVSVSILDLRKRLKKVNSEEEEINILTEIKGYEEAKKLFSATLGRIVIS